MSISVGYKREKKQFSKTKDGDKREVKQMIIVKTYRGHIRNWEELCERLGIDLTLSREEREHEILIKAYQTCCRRKYIFPWTEKTVAGTLSDLAGWKA